MWQAGGLTTLVSSQHCIEPRGQETWNTIRTNRRDGEFPGWLLAHLLSLGLTLKFCNNKADEGVLWFAPGLGKPYHQITSHNLCLFRVWLRKANTYTWPPRGLHNRVGLSFTVLLKMLFVKLKIRELCRGGSLRFGENNAPGQATWHCFFRDTFCSGKMS